MNLEQLLPSLVSGGAVAALLTTIGLIVVAFISRRTRTPEIRLAEAQFSVKVYQDQLLEARADKELNDRTIDTFRDYVTELEASGRDNQERIRDLYKQIHELEARNAEKDKKICSLQNLIDRVAEKVARGEMITLADLGRSVLPDNLEDTDY